MNRLQSPRLNDHAARGSPSPFRQSPARVAIFSPKPATQGTQDSGYFGSQDVAPVNIHMDSDFEDGQDSPQRAVMQTTTIPLKNSPNRALAQDSPEKTFQTAREDQTTRISADASKKIVAEAQFGLGHESEYEDDVSPERQLSLEAKQSARYPDDAPSPSDNSSPIRPIVRKSSLNFASLPAREPLTAGKSNGARVSRTSHLDHIRTSYYNRPTGGKSLGGTLAKLDRDDDRENEIDVDDDLPTHSTAAQDTKTYTQRLQDQINMLGQSQAKSAQVLQQTKTPAPKVASPIPLNTLQSTPGAFPEDDDDDWIEPPATVVAANEERPSLPKSYSADVMEGIQGKKTIGQTDFILSDGEGTEVETQLAKPNRYMAKPTFGHTKSASVPVVPNVRSAMGGGHPLKKVVSVSNPSLVTVAEAGTFDTPSKSPSRAFRESPLKQVKNKLSSILKSSRGLLASSAAISAEGKSLMSPSSTRLGLHSFMSSESVVSKQRIGSQGSQSTTANQDASPTRPMRRTRASVEKEREEKKREKDARRLEEQNEKLEKARQKEREKARVFSKEQEKIAAMEKQIASKKEDDRSAVAETPKPTRTGLRNAKDSGEETAYQDKDTDMEDASLMPPPSAPRSAGPTHATRNKEIKRPLKPMRETQTRPKQAPTVIRVNTGSQHSQYRLSTVQPEASSHATAQTQHQLTSKASKVSLQPKPSTQSLRGAAAASRTKAQELAARKKDQEDKEAQKRRDAKAEMERKRAAAQEEQRKQEQLRRQEAERQRQQQQQQQQEQAASQSKPQTKSNAQRKAAIEKAKQTRAPPPALRSQPNGPPDSAMAPDSRPASRMTSNAQWNQDEPGRPVNAVLSNAGKAGSKRTFAQEKGDDNQGKHPQSRGGPAYQANDAKRRRTSEVFDDEADTSSQKNIKGPPVRPSAGFKKVSCPQNGHINHVV